MKKLILLTAMMMSLTAYSTEIDLKKSELQWKGTKVTGEHFGSIKFKKAKVETKEKGQLAGAEIIVDMNTVHAKDLEGEWQDKFHKHIKSKDFFHVDKYPTSKLVVTKVGPKEMKGKLTIKGKTHNVVFPYKKEGNVYKGKLTFDRTKFGMIYGSGDFFKNLGDKLIHNKVNVDFKIVMKD